MSDSKRISWLPTLTVLLVVSACAQKPDLPFPAEIGEPPDFAAIERDHPLNREHRSALTAENLKLFSQAELDTIYARLTAGPIPDGPYQGTIIFAEGGGPKKLAERLGTIAQGIVDLKLDKLEFLGERLWKGKVFFKSDRLLRNQIEHEVALLFPAELYCGDSLLDPRRDSVIIDYARTAELPGFIPEVDYLAGADKLRVRDEIRMIRPGFYLGRAYLREKFALTFTLLNKDVEAAGVWPDEECWDGSGPKPEQPADEEPAAGPAAEMEPESPG